MVFGCVNPRVTAAMLANQRPSLWGSQMNPHAPGARLWTGNVPASQAGPQFSFIGIEKEPFFALNYEQEAEKDDQTLINALLSGDGDEVIYNRGMDLCSHLSKSC